MVSGKEKCGWQAGCGRPNRRCIQAIVIFLWALAILHTGSLLAQTSVAPEFGTGSTADPYQIGTLNNLYWLSQERNVWDRHFVLTANIDARSTETWDEGRGFSPIGFCEGFFEPTRLYTDCDDHPELTSNPFTGTFDGQSFTISGLTIDRQTMNSVGLFGHGSGSNVVIKNLRLEQVNITGFENVGGVVGSLDLGRLENVSATGNVTAIRHKAGGLMGIGNNAVLTDRNVFLGTVTARNEAGGLVGRAREATAVSLSYARGNIVETAGDLSSNLGGAGGLVGNSGNRSDFRNLYFAGTVTSPGKANAIAGNYNQSDDFSNVYWDADLFSGDPAAPGGIATPTNLEGLTTAQMQGSSAQSNMLFDNFTDSWQVITSPQDGYPVFNWQSGNPVPVVSGTLFDQNNQPLGGGITVSAIPNSAFFNVEETTTDANGAYAFSDVIFDAPDYIMAASTIVDSRTISANVFFDPSTTSTLDLTLTPNVEVTDISAENTAGTTIAITVTVTEPLSGLLVAVTGPSASNLFLENGFAETANGDGTFSYSRDYEASQDGAYTFTVDEAIGDNGANGAQDEFTTVGISSFVVTTVAVNGSITSPRNPGVNVNETTTVTGTADSDHFFSAVSGCGGTAQSNSNQTVTSFSYTTGPITEDCTVTATFSFLIDGDGTPGNPFQITSWAQLDSVRNELDAHYLLMNTLDSNSSGYSTYNTDEGWTPIGTPGNPFTGSFDGNGFAINDLFLAGDHPAYGLFGATGAGASLTALTMTDVNISSQQNAQSGPFGVLVGGNAGTVSGVALDSGTVTGLAGADVGGLVGTNVGTITNSTSNIAVFGGGVGALGGLVGATTGGTITDSRSSGGVSADGGALEPGIFFGSNDATALTRSHATAIVLNLTQQPVVEANAAPLATQPAMEAVDSHGLRDLTLGAAQTVLAEIGSGAGATLGGTTTIALEAGFASYDNLSFTGAPGVEYTLAFSSPGLGGVTSDTFQLLTVGGEVSGLVGDQVVLQNSGGDDLAINNNGGFTFPAQVDGTDYNVTVATQPGNPIQTCSVANATGTLAGTNVSNVDVTCVTNQFTVGGNVSGLTGDQVVLQNNGGDDIAINADGGFTFTAQNDGTDYNVTVATQPGNPSQTCSVANAAGTLAGAGVSNVAVTCTIDQFTVGGAVSGLAGDQVVLQNNAGDDLAINADGAFAFSTALDDLSDYEVTVLIQPSGQQCSITQATGTLAGSDISDVSVECNSIALAVDIRDLSFDELTLGQLESRTATITNSGNADLIIQGFDAPESPFSFDPGSCAPLPLTLAAQESCSVQISAQTPLEGTFSDILSIISNAGSSPDGVSLRASAAAVTIPVLGPLGLLLLVGLTTLVAFMRLGRVE